MLLLYKTKTETENDFTNAVNAVIDESSFDRIIPYIGLASTSLSAEVIAGGSCNKTNGHLIEPIVIVVSDPHFSTMG
jgi:1-pyrroline-5-carboxylate dehydrogenase